MKLPEWITIAASSDSPIRTALLCVCSYYRNRNRRDFTRPSRSRRAVAGQVPILSPQLHREHRRMVRLYARDARAAIEAARTAARETLLSPAPAVVEVPPDPTPSPSPSAAPADPRRPRPPPPAATVPGGDSFPPRFRLPDLPACPAGIHLPASFPASRPRRPARACHVWPRRGWRQPPGGPGASWWRRRAVVLVGSGHPIPTSPAAPRRGRLAGAARCRPPPR